MKGHHACWRIDGPRVTLGSCSSLRLSGPRLRTLTWWPNCCTSSTPSSRAPLRPPTSSPSASGGSCPATTSSSCWQGAEEPVGFALLTLRPTPYFDGPLAQLEELYVVPRLRGQGLGTALLDAAIGLVRTRDAGEMHINVDEIDTDTRRFYERHGFVNIEPGEDYRMLCYLREL